MQLFNGRPQDEENRLQKEIRVYDFLDSLGIEYLRVDHDEAGTIELCREIDIALGCEMCKNLFLCNRQKTNFYLLMMPGDKHFETKVFSKQLDIARVSFADGEFMEKFLDITPGSVSVLGLMNDKELNVKLVVDKDLLSSEYIGCHPCINTSSLRIKTKDVMDKIIPATNHDAVVIELLPSENAG